MQIGKCQLISADGVVVADDQLYDRSTFADHQRSDQLAFAADLRPDQR